MNRRDFLQTAGALAVAPSLALSDPGLGFRRSAQVEIPILPETGNTLAIHKNGRMIAYASRVIGNVSLDFKDGKQSVILTATIPKDQSKTILCHDREDVLYGKDCSVYSRKPLEYLEIFMGLAKPSDCQIALQGWIDKKLVFDLRFDKTELCFTTEDRMMFCSEEFVIKDNYTT